MISNLDRFSSILLTLLFSQEIAFPSGEVSSDYKSSNLPLNPTKQHPMKVAVMIVAKDNYVSGPELDVAFGVEVGPSPHEKGVKAFVVAVEVEGRSTAALLASSINLNLHDVKGFLFKWIFFFPLFY